MDQEKIGRFIAYCRKENGLTQAALAEKLGITDRAVSKWENGKSLPDASIMLELCSILNINVNELLTGERLNMNNYKEIAEQNLLEMARREEEINRNFLKMETVIGYMSSIAFMVMIFVASFVDMDTWLRILLIAIGSVILAFGIGNALRIEQTAGYYECAKCHHKYVPTYQSAFWAMHVGRTRYMRCPKCGEKSWQKKVLTK